MKTIPTFIESLKTGESNPMIEVISKNEYTHNGAKRTQYKIRKLRSKRMHYVYAYENGGFASCMVPTF